MSETILIVLAFFLLACLIGGGLAFFKLFAKLNNPDKHAEQQTQLGQHLEQFRQIITSQLTETRQSTESQQRDSRETFDRRINELTQHVNLRLGELNTQLHQQLAENRKQSGETNKALFERLDASGKMFAQITEQFGHLRESSKHLAELGSDINQLHKILAPSGPRGHFGEHLLEELLRNVLPADAYSMQHTFKGGQTVDAIVRLAHGVVCIDSKFPLPAFERFVHAQTTDDRKVSRKDFVRDCRSRISEIASKYIRPDEGTLDFALMYIPAENVYYETIITHRDLAEKQSIAEYASEKNVICVSPNTLLSYLHVILIGLRGLKIEENARDILGGLARISGDYKKFAADFRLVGTHMDRAKSKFADAEKCLETVTHSLDQVTRLGHGETEKAVSNI